MSDNTTGTRLNKYLASCGVGSRRACDTIIKEGDVFINNSRVDNPALRVGPDDVVRVGKKTVTPKSTEVILFNKPRGLVSSASDELGRETIYAALPPQLHHLKNVGRLDKESEGMLVLTNDGDLALKLTHPSQKVEKEYLVTVNQAFDNEIIDKLIKGVHTVEGRAAAKSIKRISPRRLRVVLETGLKRQIRIMFDAVHIKVTKLVRIRIGTLTGGGLETGQWRTLDAEEIQALQQNPRQRQPRVSDDGGQSGDEPARKSSPRGAKGLQRRTPMKKKGTKNFQNTKRAPKKTGRGTSQKRKPRGRR
ncbi:rRNA pseudouridine synthase [Verrucomicrobiaceae bacterium 5K15]|uniref:rRNA pseudouridine synthase n=1 Tax=Oceaniferula flava TaxID=2800421 RepID=A0AAE2SBR5_9BACT|nr:pseudouridine synthase [Oceaniferula flavus]MBK1854824.1 rRNA pseudouridine synthase [Oceaniferula flavus]MBM1136130.1 rRNA pseudouridine synthase [Oceaniferula flavus]